MVRKFNPNTNPYADDLLRLSLAPLNRYSHAERHALGRIIASKLYQLELVAPYYTDLGHSCWISKTKSGRHVEIVVIFDADPEWPDLWQQSILHSRAHTLILLSAGENGVIELFKGAPDALTAEHVQYVLHAVHAGENIDTPRGHSDVRATGDAKAAADYRSNGTSGKGDRDNGRPGADGNGGDGGDGGGGDGGGDGGGGDGGGGIPGSGGVRELMNHPVLFTVEQQVLDSILEQI